MCFCRKTNRLFPSHIVYNDKYEQSYQRAATYALKRKNLDAICLNTITQTHNPLESQNNQILFITDKESQDLGFCDKFSLAFKILQQAQNLW